MLVHPPDIRCENGSVHISAQVEIETSTISLPETLWFSVPKTMEASVRTSWANVYAAALVPLAMALGEDLHVCGTVSPLLHSGLTELQELYTHWYPHLKPIRISADVYQETAVPASRGTLSPFSGGVDSFYTIWTQAAEREPNPHYCVTHALFVHGFDISLDDHHTYDVALKAYRQIAEKRGIELLAVSTNLKEFCNGNGLEWEMTNTGALLSTALLFESDIARVFLPLNDTCDYAQPAIGVHPIIVPYYATANVEPIAHGATVSKLEKVRAIAEWQDTYDTLRVCWKHPNGLTNCGRCWKCTYTMAILSMADALEHYTTFAHPLTRRGVRSVRFFPGIYQYVRWLQSDAWKTRRFDLLFDYTIAAWKSRVRDAYAAVRRSW